MKSYHNTCNIQNPELAIYEAKAEKQDTLVLEIFKEREGIWMNPFMVHSILRAKTGKDIPITSVRRSITNNTKAGNLLKSVEAKHRGIYNAPNHSWTFNRA